MIAYFPNIHSGAFLGRFDVKNQGIIQILPNLTQKGYSSYILGVRTQIVISNSSLRERRGYTKFYYITDLFSVDMAIYDSIVSFQKIDAY